MKKFLGIALTLLWAVCAPQLTGTTDETSTISGKVTKEHLNALTYGNGWLVAVGCNGMILTSIYGSDLSMASSGGKNLNAAAFGNNKFVAVGDSCAVMTSNDGSHWVSRTLSPGGSSLPSKLLSITYGNNLPAGQAGQFVAAGLTDDNTTIIFTSADGVSWKKQLSDKDIPIYALAYGNSTFVGVGADRALVSSDAIHWTSCVVEPDIASMTGLLVSVVWGGNQFVAVGDMGLIYTSPDGKIWTKRDSHVAAHLVGAVWQGNRFTVLGYNYHCPNPDSVIIATSSDGITWASFLGWTSPTATSAVTALTYGDGAYIIVGKNGLIASSSDGTTWKNKSTINTKALNDICWNNGQAVAVGTSGTIISSADGLQWKSHLSVTTNDLLAVGCGNNCFIAVGHSGAICASINGSDWMQVSSPTLNNLTDITWGNGRFVAVGDKKLILSSTDGRKWDITMPQVDTMRATIHSRVAYGNYGFVTVDSLGEMFTSTDGLTWKMKPAESNVSYRGVAWGGDKYVVVGQDVSRPQPEFFFLTSADGQVWTSRQSIAQAPYLNPIKIAWGANQFVVLDGNKPFSSVFSADGLTWSLLPDPCAFSAFNALAWDGTQYIFVGAGGAIESRPPF